LSRPGEASAARPGWCWSAWSPSSGSGAASEVVVIEVAFRQQEAGAGAVASPGTQAERPGAADDALSAA
jgi:hypothetical protein